MNYIEDIKLQDKSGYNVIVEIPKGTKSKLELVDRSFDRMCEVKVMKYNYPYYYGCFPRTFAPDNDPLDAIIISNKKHKSLDILNIQPVAVIKTVDKGEQDDKVICVVADEKTKVNPKKILHFLLHFRGKKNTETVVDTKIYDQEEAIKTIERCNKRYMNAWPTRVIKIDF